MRNSLLKPVVGAGLLSLTVVGIAQAGGFSRGTADTDLLFEDGNFNMRVDARVVVPTQKFSVNANPALVGTNTYDTYMIPSAAVKFNITDNSAVRRHLDAERRGGCRIRGAEISERQGLRELPHRRIRRGMRRTLRSRQGRYFGDRRRLRRTTGL